MITQQTLLRARATAEVAARVRNFRGVSSLAVMVDVYANDPAHWQYGAYFITAIRESGHWPATARRIDKTRKAGS